MRGNGLSRGRRRGHVLVAHDDQRTGRLGLQRGQRVGGRDGGAAAGITFHRRGADHRAHLRHQRRLCSAEGLGEPARQRGLFQRLQALAARDAHAVGPHRRARGGHLAGGIGQHHAVQHLGVSDGQHLADHAAHRQPQPMRARHAQVLQQAVGVVGQLRQRVGRRRHAGAAVAACVVAQHREVLRKRLHLRVPHAQVHRQ